MLQRAALFILILLTVLALALAATAVTYSLDLSWSQSRWGLEPPVRNGSAKWRIGYYEGGAYRDYPLHLKALVEGWIRLGWIEPMDLEIPSDSDNAVALWRRLVHEARSDYLEFLPEACWSNQWDSAIREVGRKEALAFLQARGADLMIAMGTQAGLDLRDGHDVPTIVVSATSPIQSGIIDSIEDSGRDHLHALCDPKRHERQVRAFYNIVRFRRLGVVMNEAPQARVYAHLPAIEKVAREFGFEIVTEVAHDEEFPQAFRRRFPDETDEQLAARQVRSSLNRLVGKVDALWITDHRGFDPEFMPGLLGPLLEHRVVTWSPTGAEHLRRGVVLGMPEKDLDDLGLRHARVAAAIFHGASPRELPQEYQAPRAILLNEAAARLSGFKVPPGLHAAADKVYRRIENGPDPTEGH
jgi:hypothetical protein